MTTPGANQPDPSSLRRFVVGATVGVACHFAVIAMLTWSALEDHPVMWLSVVLGFLAFMYGGFHLARRKGRPGLFGVTMGCFSADGLAVLAVMPSRSLEADPVQTGSAPKGDRRLFSAVEQGDAEELESLLAEGVEIDGRNRAGRTALHVALDEGQAKLAKRLLESGASVNCRDRLGNTPLHLAAELGSSDIAERILEAGAKIDARGNDGWTPLHCAAAWDARSVARLLAERGADLAAKNDKGLTPAEQGDYEKHPEVARILREIERESPSE